MIETPPLPEGFEIEQSETPPLPAGFQIERQPQINPYEQAVRDGTANSVKYGSEPGVGDLVQNSIPFSDEIIGGLRGTVSAIGEIGSDLMDGQMPDGVGDAFQGTYDDTVGDMRARVKVAREKYGITPEIVGGFATGAPAIKAISSAANAGKEMVKQGMIWGGLSAAGEAEGGLQERGVAGAKGAAFGAAAGKGLHLTGKSAGKMAPYIGRAVKRVGIGRATDDHLHRSLDASGMTPEQALTYFDEGQAARSFGAHHAELPEMIADFGQGTQRLGRTVKTHTGPAGDIAADALNKRQHTQFERVNDDLQRSLEVKSKDFHQTGEVLSKKQRVEAEEMYPAAYEQSKPFSIEDVSAKWRQEARVYPPKTAERNAIDRALGYVEYVGNKNSLVTNLEAFDKAKQAIDGLIDGTMGPNGSRPLRRILMRIKDDFVKVADARNPAYLEARESFAGDAAMMNALEAGRDFAKGDYEVSRAAFRAMTQSEQKAFRLGMSREVETRLGKKEHTHNMTRDFNKPFMEEQLKTVDFARGKRRAYSNRRAELIKREGNFNSTRNTVLGGSPTAEKLADNAEFLSNTLMGMVRSRGMSSGVQDFAVMKIGQLFEVRAKEAESVARILFETDPKIIRTTLRRLASTMRPSKFTRIRQFVERQRKSINMVHGIGTFGVSGGLGREQGTYQNDKAEHRYE